MTIFVSISEFLSRSRNWNGPFHPSQRDATSSCTVTPSNANGARPGFGKGDNRGVLLLFGVRTVPTPGLRSANHQRVCPMISTGRSYSKIHTPRLLAHRRDPEAAPMHFPAIKNAQSPRIWQTATAPSSSFKVSPSTACGDSLRGSYGL